MSSGNLADARVSRLFDATRSLTFSRKSEKKCKRRKKEETKNGSQNEKENEKEKEKEKENGKERVIIGKAQKEKESERAQRLKVHKDKNLPNALEKRYMVHTNRPRT